MSDRDIRIILVNLFPNRYQEFSQLEINIYRAAYTQGYTVGYNEGLLH